MYNPSNRDHLAAELARRVFNTGSQKHAGQVRRLNVVRNFPIGTVPVVPVLSATRSLLKLRAGPDDIAGMFDSESAQIRENPEWLLVLAAYRDQQRVLKAGETESDGWVSRLRTVEGVCDEDLSRIHGKLIAFELLKFELEGRTTGVRYKIARAGKELLEREELCVVASDEPV